MIANVFGGDGLIVIIVALVVLVGGSQLPKIARNIGLAGKEFRNAQAEAEEEQAKAKAAASNSGAVPPPVALPPTAAAAAAPAPATPAAAPAPATPAPAPVPATPAAAPGQAAAPEGGDSITLTPAQLDALLKAREEQARNHPDAN